MPALGTPSKEGDGDDYLERVSRAGGEGGSLVEAKAQSNKEALREGGDGSPKIIRSTSLEGKAFMQSLKQDP
ncbi:hypothetical protein O181_102151 [Austropuccinia psidii MF-1]|uniref:Uncharacterized protein n=1 Tax=Austropuccinia psidii MF-1 TaxID=1389203 RepID=A0A9Q3JI42_9BASI|nr:hypothetical protein [Austropuccinia psidii MF-1]